VSWRFPDLTIGPSERERGREKKIERNFRLSPIAEKEIIQVFFIRSNPVPRPSETEPEIRGTQETSFFYLKKSFQLSNKSSRAARSPR
jgi:hypothetical protein